MYRLSIVIAILAISGCTTSGGAAGDERDRYVRAANSWEGASIREMLAAWAPPSQHVRPPKGEKDGIVRWDVRSESGTGEHKITHYHCATVAHFKPSGIISNIEVTHSRYCYRRFEGVFESLTLQKVKSDLTHFEI